MLLLRRRRGETILVGEDVTVTVMGVDDGEVVLGFEAPKQVTVLRKELATPEQLLRASHRVCPAAAAVEETAPVGPESGP